MKPLKHPIFKHITRVVDRMGVEAYAVGGFVRDYYLNRPSSDIDVVVVGSGVAVAEELAQRGARVTLISGRTSLECPKGVERVDVLSAEQMYEACVSRFEQMDGAVMCAAVADYTPITYVDENDKVSSVARIIADTEGDESNE